MRVRTILLAVLALVLALWAGTVGCQNEGAKPRQEQPPAGLSGVAQDTPPAFTAPVPTTVGVRIMHATDGQLARMRIAILATDGFEQSDLVEPRQAYASEGATTIVVSNKTGSIQGYDHDAKGDLVYVDMSINDARAAEFDALLLPGGMLSADRLRLDPKVTGFVLSFARSGRPIAAICHGLWSMIENDLVRGFRLTSCPSLRTDLKNAGAKWVDQDVAQDRNLVTSRTPDATPEFNIKTIALFAKLGDPRMRRPAIGGGPLTTE